MGLDSPVPIPRSFGITSAADLQTTYPAEQFQGRVAFVWTPPGQADEIYYAMENLAGAVTWQRVGKIGESELVVALGAATAENEGTIVTLSGGAGVRDLFYICIKNALDAYEWVQIGEIGQSEVVLALPGATAVDEGRIITFVSGAGVQSVAYICLKSIADVYNWIQFAVGGP